MKQEKLPWLANNLYYTKRFASSVGRRCRSATVRDVAREVQHLVQFIRKSERGISK